jgi:TolB-like protein/Tfp pilus assembly protein PilF
MRADLKRLKRDADSSRSVIGATAAEAPVQPWWRRKPTIGIAAVLLVTLLAGGGWLYRSRMSGGETIDSLAVLPFVNGSGDPNAEYLSDGITESLINSLSQLPKLEVKSRDSAFHYKGKDPDAETVGRELGVRAVFKGRVTQAGDNLTVSAELIDARNNDHIWGQQYSRKASDIFALQGDIAKEITTALRVRLSGEDEKRISKRFTADPEAYQDYLKGRYWRSKLNEEGLRKGIEYLQQAIAKDPTYSLAYAGLADCYSSLGGLGFVPASETFPRAKEAAEKALALDDTLAEAHTSLAIIKTFYEWDWSGAESEFQRAIALNPSYADAHQFYGLALSDMGRFEEAIAEEKRGLELDPLSLIANFDMGEALYYGRQYDKAIEQLQKTLDLDPNYVPAHYFIGDAYLQKSMYKEGIASFGKALAISPDNTQALSMLGYGYAVAGKKAEAQKVLDELEEISKRRYVPAARLARIFVGLGEKDKAFESLEKAYQERTNFSVKANPVYDPLHSDPRFADLVRRMNLQP